MSSNEIDRILTFVKYAVPEAITEVQRKEMKGKLQENLDQKLIELDELYKSEAQEAKDNLKKLKEVEKLYIDNKEKLALEFNRIKSIVADLDFGKTILESDYRNIFWKYSDIIKFVS
jgi:rRNA maturation endonuclease Nob1